MLDPVTKSITKLGRGTMLSAALAMTTFTGAVLLSGCPSSSAHAQQVDNSNVDPADANMAPVDGSQAADAQQPVQSNQDPYQDQSQQAVQQPSTGGAPVYRQAPPENESQQQADQYNQNGQNPPQAAPSDQGDQSYNPDYDNQVDAGQAALDDQETAPQAPPPLPTYQQPEAPAPDYIWTPGYWDWAPAGYYWVPGVWCAPPYYGALWTPGYWGFYNGVFRFHRGYWGPYIGFYGGINYGFGYVGTGYYGGFWRGNRFYYNTAVNRVNVTRITNVYNRTVVVNNYTRVSYNGGRGGLTVRPTTSEMVAMRQTRTPAMSLQVQNRRNAAADRSQFYNTNRGRPAITAAPRPIAADRGIARPAIRPAAQVLRPSNRPNQPQVRPNQPQVRPNQPQGRPEQPQVRPNLPQQRPNQPQVRPEAPQSRPQQPQVRPNLPQERPNQPQVRPESQPRQQEARPQPQQYRPQQQQYRPQQQQQYRPAPQQQRPQPQQQYRPQQRTEQRSAPAPRSAQEHGDRR
ncbi:hypothetical protein GCM10011507_24630 [Edaphobacter acidisoli]|uniref:YXWGXW repeat-containing protein n=1 Tax=Edaphobacter acidisoli TaxID=2040573 RepID=A0A916RW56_9BACT|nr:YXWGXW repeat-containing protein [Edaphobacter acidisoli]GGA72093.1 hypothetical protein GCM10011507_24630 [Edaphobacter acidisoli]